VWLLRGVLENLLYAMGYRLHDPSCLVIALGAARRLGLFVSIILSFHFCFCSSGQQLDLLGPVLYNVYTTS